MGTASLPVSRADEFSSMGVERSHKMITVEPIMKFDLKMLVKMIKSCDPFQVNIGADSGKNGLPEPSGEEIKDLIEALGTFTKVYLKENLKRIYAAKDNEAGT
jgi:hypothetical protein